MTTINNLYQLSTLIVGVECLVMTITIWTLGFKKFDPKKSGMRSIVFFALALCGMSVINLLEFLFGVQNDIDSKLAIVIFAAAIELFLFTFAYLAILDDRYVSKKNIITELILITVFTAPPLFVDAQQDPILFKILFYIALTFYLGKLSLNVVLYKKSLNIATQKLQNYYSEESSNILKWTNNSFFLVFTIGVVSNLYRSLIVRFYLLTIPS